MKKILNFILAFAIFFAMSSVKAADLTSSIITNDGLGGLSTFTKSYDAVNDVNEVKIKLTVNETVVNQILNQHPGTGASLSYFYMSLNPNMGHSSVYKQNWYYQKGTKTPAEIKNDLKARITDSDLSSNETVWNIGVMVQYYSTSDSRWYITNHNANGVKTIKEDIKEALGVANDSDLVYGENFRFAMYEPYEWYFVWTDANPNTTSSLAVEEYIRLTYEIAFPISSSNGNESVFHISLSDALANGYNDITVNENTTVTTDLTIPAGKTLKIANGVTVTLSGAQITNNGTIENNGVITDGTDNYYTVSVESTNGTVNVDKNLVKKDEVVTITTEANDGYQLKSVKVIKLSDNSEVTVTNNKFTMPDDNVKIIAEFEAISNPSTSDNIMFFVILALISVIGLSAVATLKKRFN